MTSVHYYQKKKHRYSWITQFFYFLVKISPECSRLIKYFLDTGKQLRHKEAIENRYFLLSHTNVQGQFPGKCFTTLSAVFISSCSAQLFDGSSRTSRTLCITLRAFSELRLTPRASSGDVKRKAQQWNTSYSRLNNSLHGDIMQFHRPLETDTLYMKNSAFINKS